MYIFNMVNKVSKVLLRNKDMQDNQIRKQNQIELLEVKTKCYN